MRNDICKIHFGYALKATITEILKKLTNYNRCRRNKFYDRKQNLPETKIDIFSLNFKLMWGQ